MFRKFIKGKRGQNTAEYALLIALVVGGAVAMQQYAQRALQARERDAGTYLAAQTNVLGSSVQYEPYYQQSNYTVNKDSSENKRLAPGVVAQDSSSTRNRDGNQTTTYGNNVASGDTSAMPSGI